MKNSIARTLLNMCNREEMRREENGDPIDSDMKEASDYLAKQLGLVRRPVINKSAEGGMED